VRDVYAFTGSGMPDGDAGYGRWAGRFLTAGRLLDAAGLAGHLEEALDEAEIAGDEATLYAAYLYSFARARDKGRLLELLRGLRDVGVDFRAAVLGQIGAVTIKLLKKHAEQVVEGLPPEVRDLETRWPHPILDALLPPDPVAPPAPAAAPPVGVKQTNCGQADPSANRLERRECVWVVCFGGREILAPVRMKGWLILAKLVGSPHRVIQALDLEGHPAEALPRSQSDGAALDVRGERDYRARIERIKEDLPETRQSAEAGDPEAEARVRQLEGELESIRAELSRQVGRRGRRRLLSAGNEAEKAADRVKSKLRDLKLAMRNDWGLCDLADHLDGYLGQVGTGWAYRPEPPDTIWHIQTSEENRG
jgi:hypothetical protein